MKRIILSVTVASMVLFAGTAMAEKPENGNKGKGAKAAEFRRGLGGPQRDPAKMVARIMTEFDQDGDQKLDKTELAAWLKVMGERRAQGMRRAGKPGNGKPGKGKLGAQGRRLLGDGDGATPGGDVPKRPDAQ